MKLSDYWGILRARWLLVAALTLLGGLLAAALSFPATPMYRATSSVYFSLPTGDSATDLSQGSTFAQSQMFSYAELANKPIVLDRVIKQLDLPTTSKSLRHQVSASASSDTVIIAITATDEEPELAASLANTTATELRGVVRLLAPTGANGKPSIDAAVVGEATVPEFPFSPQKRRNLIAGLIAGLLLGVAAAVARELLDTRIRDNDEAEQLTQAPALTQVSKNKVFRKRPVVVETNPLSTAAESYRRMRTNLRYLRTAREVDVITVTSSLPGEGKSITSLNFASACAEAGDRVLLIDGDLRRPVIAAYLGLEGSAGLTTALTDRATVEDLVQTWGDKHPFDVLTSGETPPNPSGLIDSDAMRALLEDVRGRYDLVVIDSPPLLSVTDAALFAAESSGAIVVVNVRKVHRDELMDAVASLEQVGGVILGMVVNGVSAQSQDSYYGYSGRRTRWWRLRDRRARPRSSKAKIKRLNKAKKASQKAAAVERKPSVARKPVIRPRKPRSSKSSTTQ